MDIITLIKELVTGLLDAEEESKIEILNSTLKSSGGIYFCMSSVYLCISPWYDLPILLTAVEGEYHEQIYTRKPETPYP